MSLIHYARPFLDLGICKEYCMARKTTGSSTTPRAKKAASSIQPAAVQVAPEAGKDDLRKDPGKNQLGKEVPQNGKSANATPGKPVAFNLEEEIRRRAYELYLQRRATAGDANGNRDKDQDWLVAEREILARHSSHEQHTA
jgi:hypothetical protein